MQSSDAATKTAFLICLLTTGWFTVGLALLLWYVKASGSSGEGEGALWGICGALPLTIVGWPLSIVESIRGCIRNPTRFAKIVCAWSLLLIPLSLALSIAFCWPLAMLVPFSVQEFRVLEEVAVRPTYWSRSGQDRLQ